MDVGEALYGDLLENSDKKSGKGITSKAGKIARIDGKSDVYKFKIEILGNINNFDYLMVDHYEYGGVLCLVYNIVRESGKLTGYCKILGYRQNDTVLPIRTPFRMEAAISIADDAFIGKTLGLTKGSGALIGHIEYHEDLPMRIDLKTMITRHVAILAKSGVGKSYTVGVLLEEIMKRDIPVLIIDPHNEYGTIRFPNDNANEIIGLKKYDLKPRGFNPQIKEWCPETFCHVNDRADPISLDLNRLTAENLLECIGNEITPTQKGMLLDIITNLNNRINFDELIFNISNEESNSKYSLISAVERIKKFKLFNSSKPTPLNEIIKYGRASILSLKGVDSNTREIMVTNLLRQLFQARMNDEVPPFFLIIEESHNFVPEKSYGKAMSSKIIQEIAGEGRKFGLGICLISQRPAKVNKSALSQCNTQIIMNITNALDVKAVVTSCEGMDDDSANEIKNLPKGRCFIAGILDIPMKINIRPRMSKHGGEAATVKL